MSKRGLLLAKGALLFERDDLDRVATCLGDEAALDISHFEFSRRDKLRGELLFETEPIRDRKRLINGKNGRARTDTAFVLESGLQRWVGQPSAAKLASACFLDGEEGRFKQGMMAANAGGDAGERKIRRETERGQAEEQERAKHANERVESRDRRAWRYAMRVNASAGPEIVSGAEQASQILNSIVCDNRCGQSGGLPL